MVPDGVKKFPKRIYELIGVFILIGDKVMDLI